MNRFSVGFEFGRVEVGLNLVVLHERTLLTRIELEVRVLFIAEEIQDVMSRC